MYMWHQVDHLVIQEVPALGFAAVLGNSVVMRLGRTASEAHHLLFRRYVVWGCRDVMCDIIALHMHQSCDLLL